jgi:hypothetical protein
MTTTSIQTTPPTPFVGAHTFYVQEGAVYSVTPGEAGVLTVRGLRSGWESTSFSHLVEVTGPPQEHGWVGRGQSGVLHLECEGGRMSYLCGVIVPA